ncbi:hypothetical protein BHE74_00059711 [Ensete ventricosum]|nr:hypothetical protein BHE74_00059711 [Ensete ventricosum]
MEGDQRRRVTGRGLRFPPASFPLPLVLHLDMALPILYPHPTVRLITIERTTEACIVTHNPPPVNLTSLRKEELRRFGHLNGFDSPLPGPSPLGSTWTGGKRFPPHTPFINWSRLSFLLPEKSNHRRRSEPPSRSVRYVFAFNTRLCRILDLETLFHQSILCFWSC